jgi:hypothetical protein
MPEYPGLLDQNNFVSGVGRKSAAAKREQTDSAQCNDGYGALNTHPIRSPAGNSWIAIFGKLHPRAPKVLHSVPPALKVPSTC